jgi:hypothetical protein
VGRTTRTQNPSKVATTVANGFSSLHSSHSS